MLSRDHIVIIDNLSYHKVAGIREAINSVGGRVPYLSPYSPDMNPIETSFSKFKWLIRSRKERMVESLWSACGLVSE